MKLSHMKALESMDRFGLQLAFIGSMVMTTVFFFMSVFSLSQAPLVIERSCDSRVAQVLSNTQTKEEIKAFIEHALPVRFDSNLKSDPALWLTLDLNVARESEQKELSSKGINQRVIVRTVEVYQGRYKVEADRLIAIGPVRTAVPLNLIVDISSKVRSVSNPYGLVLSFVDQIKEGQIEK